MPPFTPHLMALTTLNRRLPLLTKVTISMLCITALLVTALCMHINGALLAGGVATLAGLGGYEVGKHRKP